MREPVNHEKLNREVYCEIVYLYLRDIKAMSSVIYTYICYFLRKIRSFFMQRYKMIHI